MFKLKKIIFTFLSLVGTISVADACTRILYDNGNGNYITGRTMDWKYDIETNLWLFPAGMHRDVAKGINNINIAEKYLDILRP